MEKMYQKYKDIAEFRMIYIAEAHAADESKSTPFARERNITQQTTMEDRCATAEMMLREKELNIPVLVDTIENSVSLSYRAYPVRLCLIDLEGKKLYFGLAFYIWFLP